MSARGDDPRGTTDATNGAAAPLDVRGERLWLLPQRAVWWPARRMLIVADTHFGKSGLLRAAGLAVPHGPEREDRARLARLTAEHGARTLVVLGDFLHGPLAPEDPECAEIEAWRAALADTDVIVVAGNHDRGTRRRWRAPVDWRETPLREGPFRFVHAAEGADQAIAADDPDGGLRGFTLSGHVHPVMWLGAPRRGGLRVPVFWQRPRGLVLPSFGQFTGGWRVRPAAGECVFAVGPERVVPIR